MKFIDLNAQYGALKQEIDNEIEKVLKNGNFILGPRVNELEEKLAEYVGKKYAITCSDGTAALQLAYMAYGIGQGDAVFCPDMTFIASIEPACLLGAAPVFCDINPVSYNIDVGSLERQINNVLNEGKLIPKAIVAVDFVGNPVDFFEIEKIAQKYDLLVIEDAAQSMGASYKGKKCGSFGNIATTSFFPSKPLGAYGDGGAVFTDDDYIANKIKSLRVHGKGEDKYHNTSIGINSRLDEIQAAILLVKLRHLDEEIEIRQRIAKYYQEKLSDYYTVPYIEDYSISSYAQYVIKSKYMRNRSELINLLNEKGIPSIMYYPEPLHNLPVFKSVNYYDEDLSNAFNYSREHIGIPFSAYLNKEDQKNIVEILVEIQGGSI